MASGELEHTLLPKIIALPLFSSDALSSVAYATGEIILVLSVAGAAAITNLVPIALTVSALLAMVITSYRQTVRAYPQGGGAYRVSHENLGRYPGLLAAAALLTDYVLTVSVSIVAGVDAVVSAAPGVREYKVGIATLFILLVALANLRGVKESGTLFAIPTYGFVLSIYVVIATGFIKCIGGCPIVETAGELPRATSAVTVFLLLRAFAQGTTALTGVEAISDGVPAFRYPQSKNAATTLTIMGTISISMFLGISWLAQNMGVVFTEESEQTVIAQIANSLFGGGIFFYVVQTATAAILFLAANTAFADFPRLSSILAKDRFVPHQFMNRGDRLVFSNGIVILAGLAAALVAIFDADLNRLIHLYLVGVFISFTLSQLGMVLHWRKTKEHGWRHSIVINALGATLTTVVLFVVILTKFRLGAWIVLTAIPVIIFLMHSVNRHYEAVRDELGEPERIPTDRRPGHQHMIILVHNIDPATMRAIAYTRSVRPSDIAAVAFDDRVSDAWRELAPDIEISVLGPRRSRAASLRAFLRARRTQLRPEDFLTLIVPEMLKSPGLFELIARPGIHRLKASLLREDNVQVLDVPVVEQTSPDNDDDSAREPTRNFVCILVSGVHNATLQAVEYAETLQAADIRAVTFGLDPDETERLSNDWLSAGIPHALEIEDSPFRDIATSLTHYVRQFNPDGIHRVVTVVIPEFVVKKQRHQILHGQTALLVKRRLLFEEGVVVVSVPYRLQD